MNNYLSLAITTLVILLCSTVSGSCTDLSLIEKRMIEMDRLHKQAILHSGSTSRSSSPVVPQEGLPPTLEPSTQMTSRAAKTTQAVVGTFPYTIQISSGHSQEQCFRVAKMLRNAGYPAFTAFLEFKDRTIWHRIFVGSYSDRAKAESTKAAVTPRLIPNGLVRSMPYSIQVGDLGTVMSLAPLRKQLEEMLILPYTSVIDGTTGGEARARLLIGAFETKEDATALIAKLQNHGLEAEVVSR